MKDNYEGPPRETSPVSHVIFSTDTLRSDRSHLAEKSWQIFHDSRKMTTFP